MAGSEQEKLKKTCHLKGRLASEQGIYIEGEMAEKEKKKGKLECFDGIDCYARYIQAYQEPAQAQQYFVGPGPRELGLG